MILPSDEIKTVNCPCLRPADSVCVAEMPKVIATYQKYQACGLDVAAIAMRHDPPSNVVHFIQTRGLPFPVAIDNTGVVARSWDDVQAIPTSYLVNKRGEVVKRIIGEPDFAQLQQLIEELLAQT
jgi:peroxiredoxin